MTTFRFLADRDPWMLAEDIPDMDPAFSQIWLSCFVNEFGIPGGRAYRKLLSVHRGYHLWFYYGEKDSNDVGEHLVDRFVREPAFVRRVNREIIRHSDRLRAFAERLPETKLDALSNAQLARSFQEHDRLHTEYYQWGWIPVAADMFAANLTERLKDALAHLGIPEEKRNELFVQLTQPTKQSLIQIQQQELLRIAARIQADQLHNRLFRQLWRKFKEEDAAVYGYQTHSEKYEKLFERSVTALRDQIRPGVLRAIQRHYERYFSVNRLWIGTVSSFEHFLKELVRLVGGGVNIQQQINREQREFRANVAKQRAALRRYRITSTWRVLFNGFGDFMVTKIYRRYAQIYTLYKMEFLQKEFARRFGLTLKETRFLLPSEVQAALRTGRVPRVTLKQRTRFCVYYVEKGREMIFVGTRAQRLAKTTERTVTQVTEITGQTGCVGKATGIVRIIIRPQDMGKMQKGDVLVSIATDPDIVPAMKKAAAIVTEQGGVTSHAAIVSRELGIPCVIGTKIATKVLKDGDRVEVDATKGVVRKLPAQ